MKQQLPDNQDAMSLLHRAEGYCLHKALASQDNQALKDYLDAANWFNYLWRLGWNSR